MIESHYLVFIPEVEIDCHDHRGSLSFSKTLELFDVAKLYAHIHYAISGNHAINNPPPDMIGFDGVQALSLAPFMLLPSKILSHYRFCLSQLTPTRFIFARCYMNMFLEMGVSPPTHVFMNFFSLKNKDRRWWYTFPSKDITYIIIRVLASQKSWKLDRNVRRTAQEPHPGPMTSRTVYQQGDSWTPWSKSAT